MPRHAKATKNARDEEMIKGLRKHRQMLSGNHAQGMDSIDAMIARFQEHLDAMQAARQKDIEWRMSLVREKEIERDIRGLMTRVKLQLEAVFGISSAHLRDFGIKPYVRRKPSMATMRLAIEKRQATREVRHTMGSRQRKKIASSAESVGEPVRLG